MKRLRKLIPVIFLLGCAKGFAQDPAFSQSYYAPIYLNPALTGTNEGLRINLNDMRQWTGVPGTVNTFHLSADMGEACKSIGFGLVAMHDVRGEGFLSTTKFGATGSWYTPLIRQKLDVAFGLGANYSQKNLDWDKLEFTSQFDPVLGKITDANSQLRGDGANYVDIDGGISFKWAAYRNGNIPVLTNFGLAVHHLNEPVEAFYTESRLPRRFTVHIGSMIAHSRNWKMSGRYIFPYFIYNWQGGKSQNYYRQTELNTGVYVLEHSFIFGAFYRNAILPLQSHTTNQVGLALGYQIPFTNSGRAFQAIYSYTMPTNGVSFSAVGTHELGLLMMFDASFICPNYKSPSGTSKCFGDKKSGFIPQL